MMRELHEVMAELTDTVAQFASAAKAGVRVSALELDLPMDVTAVLRGGTCTLLADVPRNHADVSWRGAPTRLRFSCNAAPVEDAP